MYVNCFFYDFHTKFHLDHACAVDLTRSYIIHLEDYIFIAAPSFKIQQETTSFSLLLEIRDVICQHTDMYGFNIEFNLIMSRVRSPLLARYDARFIATNVNT